MESKREPFEVRWGATNRNFWNRLVVPRFVWDFWRFKMTVAGRLLLAVLTLSAFGLITVFVPMYQVFSALLGLFVVSALAGLAFRPRVRLEGRLPSRASVGEPARGQFRLTNTRGRSAFDLSLGFIDLTRCLRHVDRDASVPSLAGGESVTLPVTLLPERRGLHELPPLRAYSTFPFHLFRSGSSRVSLPPLLVLPSFQPLTELSVPVSTRHQPGGVALTSNVGESPEYIGNREYVPGEPVRRIDFRAWGRLGKPVVREYQEEYYCRVAVVLDTHVTPQKKSWGGLAEKWGDVWYFPAEEGPETFPELEAAVSLTAAVADSLSRGEYLIDLFAAGPELYVFQAGRHVAHLENLLEILACVGPCRENPFATVTPRIAEELGQISTVICILLDWDESRRQLARAVVEAGCELKRILVRDRPPTLPLDDAELGECPQYTPEQVSAGAIETL